MAEQYDVYGLGNALVDVQYEVTPAFLEKLQIEKGVMTLVDEERQRVITTAIDHPPHKQSSGGSAANSMIAVAHLGGRAYYACKVGNDDMGEFYLQDLETAGVACNRAHRGDGVTGLCLVLITPDADRTMNTFLGITSTFGPEQVEEAVVAASKYLYIEGYLLSSDTGFAAALMAQECARKSGAIVALTLSDPFIVQCFRERIGKLLDAGVDLLFCNEDEARAWTGADDTDTACARLGEVVLRFAVTCGADGAKVRDGQQILAVPGFAVQAVDTNGAGDAFAGAFLYGLTHGHQAARSAKLASYIASRVVARFGPRLEGAPGDEVARILAN